MQIERKTVEGRAWQTQFEVQIDLGSGLARREQIILYNSARTCEVNKLLNGELAFHYTLTESFL